VNLKVNQVSDLNKIINVISKFDGVIGVLLFGSFARGDYDEYSDYDLLVIFEDRNSMWGCWDDLFQSVGSLKMNLHLIPETLEEFKNANPVFLEELSKHGKVVFARQPLEVSLKPLKLKSFCVISYDLSGLSYKDKMRVSYFLYKNKKRSGGAVADAGGIKLSEGCILVPSSISNHIIAELKSFGVKTKKLEIYLSEEHLKMFPVDDQILESS
jgi:predicted nucleotidyltransferase